MRVNATAIPDPHTSAEHGVRPYRNAHAKDDIRGYNGSLVRAGHRTLLSTPVATA